jgi:outer membrane protein assembly factor BamA
VDLRLAEAFRQLDDTGGIEPETRLRLLATGRRIDMFYPRITGEIGAGWDYLTFEAYTMTGPIAQLGVQLPVFARWLDLRIGWQFAYQTFRNISEVLDDGARETYGLDENRRLASYQQSIAAELRDDPSNPRYGAYIALRLAEGTPYAGGEYSYLQLNPDLRFYVPFGPIVLALHGRAGTIIGDVPVTERYFAGGSTSQRGFPYRALAPSVTRDIDGDTRSVLIGGTASYETSVEIRATVGSIYELPIVTSLFLDSADVVEKNDQLFDKVPHIALGVGFGVIVGGFKVRLDIGHRMNRKGPAEPHYSPDEWIPNTEIQLGIGDAF